MPEIIEIRSYADLLRRYTKSHTLAKIIIHKGRYKKHGPFEGYTIIQKQLPLRIVRIQTKGKFLYIELEKQWFILNTCGLSGGWCFKSSNNQLQFSKNFKNYSTEEIAEYTKILRKHLNIEFVLNNNTSLFFYDSLSFGTLKVIQGIDHISQKLNTIGPDVMDSSTTIQVFMDRLILPKNQTKEIGIVLMDQSVISGIGNYLRSEILYLSKINPFRTISTLRKTDIQKIFKYSKMLIWGLYDRKKAIQLKWLDPKTKLAYDHQRVFFVYKQKKDIYGNAVVIKELYQGSQKRFIYYVPRLQK